jgi:hypothetical protein
MNYFKKLETILIAFIILILGLAYGVLSGSKANAPTTDTNIQTEQEQSQQVPATSSVRYEGQDGRTAMDLLKSNYRVETQSFGDMGDFVTSIDGVEPDSSHFWAFYLNGAQAQVGAGAYVTKSSDQIEWKLEEIR